MDDFAVELPGAWDSDGAALLLAAAKRLVAADGVDAVVVVTAHADRPKSEMLASLSLTLAEHWWVRELLPVGWAAPPGRLSGPGFSGELGPAPGVAREDELRGRGWHVASDWYLGIPKAPER